MTEGTTTSSLFEATRLGLSRLALNQADELSHALECFCQTSAAALTVERVGIWFISTSGDELRCAALYELSLDRSSAGATLSVQQLPGYLEALGAHRVLQSPGPGAQKVSDELARAYLGPLDIRATLDAPVFR